MEERAALRQRGHRSADGGAGPGQGADPRSIGPLSQALRKDRFWAVRGAAARALSEVRTGEACAVLCAALAEEKHPRARRQMVKALGSFRHQAPAQQALATVLAGDASYFVEAEAAQALARSRHPQAFALLTEAMGRPSFLDVLLASCLSGLAELHDERGIEVAIAQGRRGRSIQGRRAAVSALGKMGEEFYGRRRQVLEALSEALDNPDFRLRIAAVDAIREMADGRGRPLLRRAAERDLDGRVRRHAREAIKALSEGGAAKDDKAAALRGVVEKLEEENLGLRERLARIEARLGIAGPRAEERAVPAGATGGPPQPGGDATALLDSDASPESEVRHEGKES